MLQHINRLSVAFLLHHGSDVKLLFSYFLVFHVWLLFINLCIYAADHIDHRNIKQRTLLTHQRLGLDLMRASPLEFKMIFGLVLLMIQCQDERARHWMFCCCCEVYVTLVMNKASNTTKDTKKIVKHLFDVEFPSFSDEVWIAEWMS